MNSKKHFVLLICALFLLPQLLISQDNPYSMKWGNGFKLESKNKDFKLKFGGRIMVDHAFFSQDEDMDVAFGELGTKNGTEFRRARFFSSGTVYNNIGYKLQLDFTGGGVAMKDAYIQIKKIPVIGSFKVGHFKEPFRFDALTSSKYITFMERALLIDFSQERNNGFMIANDLLDKKLSFQAGLFRAANGYGDDEAANDGYSFTGRLTGLALNNKENKQLLHLGVGYSHRVPESETYKVSSRPEAHLSGTKYISTGTIADVENIGLLNFEGVFVMKALTFQGEYLMANVKTLNETLNLSSYYGQLSYFLTGESKKYKNSYAGFDRVKPKSNFGNGGYGAWELTFRYSNSNLSDKSVSGGEQTDMTFGLNWYLNPASRVMFNTVLANVKDFGKVTVFQTRFQIDF